MQKLIGVPREYHRAFKAGHSKALRKYIDEKLAVKLWKRILADPADHRAKYDLLAISCLNDFYDYEFEAENE